MAAGLAEVVARQYVSWMREYVLSHNKRHPQEIQRKSETPGQSV